MLFSYPLLNHLFEHESTGEYTLLFTIMYVNDWDLLGYMEAIVDILAPPPAHPLKWNSLLPY